MVTAPAVDPPALTPPRLLRNTELKLPKGASLPPEGIVLVLTLDGQGAVNDVEFTQSLDPAVEEAARDGARRLGFAPAQRDGRAVSAKVRFVFRPAPTDGTGTDPAQGAAPAPDGSPAAQWIGEDEYSAQAQVEKKDPAAATQVTLRGEELRYIPGTFGEPLRVVSALPGVARSPFGLGFFVVRGASFQNTGFLVDGFSVPLLYHLGAGPAIISSRLVDSLDFYPGGYPARFGRYTAGLIELSTAPPPTDGVFFEFEVDLLKASALVVVPFADGKGSVALSFRRSYYELFLPLVTDSVSLSYTDYQLRLDYQLSERLSTSLFFFGSRDFLDVSGDTGSGTTTGSSQSGLTYSFDRVIGKLVYKVPRKLLASYAFTMGPSSIGFGNQSTGDASLGADTESFRLGQRIEVVIQPGGLSETRIGFEQNAFLTDLSASAPNFADIPGIPKPGFDGEAVAFEERIAELNLAPYVEQIFRPGRFEISTALRAEFFHYGDVSQWEAEPRGVVRYALSDQTTLKAATGLFSQSPLPFELARNFGNPALQPNRAWQSSVGTEIQLPWSLEIDSSLFFNRMWQLGRGVSDLELDDEGKPTRAFLDDDGQGRAYGWELLLRRRVDEGLFGWLAYTLSRSERFVEGGEATVFGFDQTHVLNIAVSYKWGGWRFGTRFTLASGRPFADLSGADDLSNVVYDGDSDGYLVESLGETRLPAYHQLDVRIDRDWTLGPVDGSVYLEIINVYAARNSEAWAYEYDFTRRVRVPGLPFLPTIGVRGTIQ